MPTSRLQIRAFALLFAATPLQPQTTSPTPPPQTQAPPAHKPTPLPFNPNLIFLDPAHGGTDSGAHLGPNSEEKDATLAFAKRLRDLLAPLGFTVLLTHESAAIPTPPPPPQPLEDGTIPSTLPFNPAANNPTPDTRVEQANRSRAVACLILHAANGGHGIHLYTSALAPAAPPDPNPTFRALTPWDAAQAPVLAQSAALASDLATALNGIRLPLVTARASIRPIDSMTCPAVAVELAPLTSGDTQTSPSDPAYQGLVAQAIAAALYAFRTHAQTQAVATQAAAQAAKDATRTTQPATPAPKPKPRPRPIVIPQETPTTLTPDPNPPRTPAPIVRRPPPDPAIPPADNPGATP